MARLIRLERGINTRAAQVVGGMLCSGDRLTSMTVRQENRLLMAMKKEGCFLLTKALLQWKNFQSIFIMR